MPCVRRSNAVIHKALKLLGFGGKPKVVVERVRFEPRKVTIGGRVVMTFTLRSSSRQPQDLLVDAAVHFVKARGTTPKVFKIARVVLPPRGSINLRATFSLAVHTTRVPRPGRHVVDVIVNGQKTRAGSFEVVASSRRTGQKGLHEKNVLKGMKGVKGIKTKADS